MFEGSASGRAETEARRCVRNGSTDVGSGSAVDTTGKPQIDMSCTESLSLGTAAPGDEGRTVRGAGYEPGARVSQFMRIVIICDWR